MKWIVLIGVYLTLPFVSNEKCSHCFYFWKPYFGEITANNFVGATDMLGIKSYIGKIVAITEKRSWTQPTQILYDHAIFAWEDGKVRRTHRFMEILTVEKVYRKRLQWLAVHSKMDLDNIIARTCLVEGGIVKYEDETVITYIGRTETNGSFFIGPVFSNDWVLLAGMHYMNGWEKKHLQIYYEVLGYRPSSSPIHCPPPK